MLAQVTEFLYGITEEQYLTQFAVQDGRCAICRTDKWGGKHDKPNTDHDSACCPAKRACGKCFRGILCEGCNQGIGKLGHDPLRLIAAARYLLTAMASETGAGEPCDDPGLLAGALRFLAGGDPARLRAAADYLERALAPGR